MALHLADIHQMQRNTPSQTNGIWWGMYAHRAKFTAPKTHATAAASRSAGRFPTDM